MEDGVVGPCSFLSAPMDSAMDLGYMDEMLLDGCWLETTDGSEFFNSIPSTTVSLFDPSFIWPTLETNNTTTTIWNPNQFQTNNNQSEKQKLLSDEPQGRTSLDPSRFTSIESQISTRWWIGPRSTSGPSTSVMERLVQALKYINDLKRDKDALIQLWVPVHREGKDVLVTNNQPYMLDPNSQSLANYREISVDYQFTTDEDSRDSMGLPGRVFFGKVPEWTPDVRFFKSEEYPRVSHAKKYDVCGTLAIPVFDQNSKTCVGVIEVVTTKQMLKSQPELDSVCKALEAVNLRSSEVPRSANTKANGLSYQAALPEIREVLRCACETHKLPLAQTWVRCSEQGKAGCRHSNENYIHCVSTVDDACYVADSSFHEFQEACSEHHLLEGQGVAGKAFMTNQPCFYSDITSYKKTEYPLSHHARMFRLYGAVAIRLRCIHTGTADFVLEFFLPVNCREPEEQRRMLSSLSAIIQQVCRSLRVVSDKELEEETGSSLTSDAIVPPCVEQEKVILHKETLRPMVAEEPVEETSRGKFEFGGDSTTAFNECNFSGYGTRKIGEKRRTKVEKTITLDVLRQYFAGSLKDAAKSIGVCPTTLKRICRQHGIQRWPSRKIKKVGHSLQKIQRVIDSVQGVSGALQIDSFYASFPELAANSKLSNPKPITPHPKPPTSHPEAQVISKSPSGSQSSSSSQCCSSGTQEQPSSFNISGIEDSMYGESLVDNVFKRVRSEPDLHLSGLVGSESYKTFKSLEILPTLPETQSRQASAPVDSLRIKVTYGDEKIRLRMQNSWGFKDLLQEISRRFNIDDRDISRLDVKYLDDDSEWVLLTCDADLEECIDISQFSQTHMIKLSLEPSHHLWERSSGSSCPF